MRDIFGSLMRDGGNSWGDKGLSETFAEGFALAGGWLVEELGLAGLTAAHLGLAGEECDLCWGWAAESCPWSQTKAQEPLVDWEHPSVHGR